MSRRHAARVALTLSTAFCSLVAVASAGAAGWQGPATISEPVADTGAKPVIALGRSGDAAALWLDDGAAGGRIAIARKRAGAAWSAPLTVVSPITGAPLFAGVDGEGSITAAYPSGSATTILTWPATVAAPTLTPLPGSFTVTGLAVDAAGDAVIAGQTGSPAGLLVGYRKGPSGAFAFDSYSSGELGSSVTDAAVAINATGTAIVVATAGATLRAATRTSVGDWPPLAETVTASNVTGAAAVGIDDAGNAIAAFGHSAGAGVTTLRSALRPAAGGWLVSSSDLSPASAGSLVSSESLAVAPSGAAALVWLQSSGATQSVKGRLGATATGFPGQTEDVSDAGAMDPVAAIGDDGAVVAVWERAATGGTIGQARVRSPGATGTWGDTRALTMAHPNATSPSLASDGRGDFATLSSPYDGTRHPLVLSLYDAAPPAVTSPTLTGGPFAGIPVTLATTARDAWSVVGAPLWTFGDGGAAAGLSVAHTYAAGTYTAHVSVTDALGNSAGADVVVVAKAAAVTIDSAAFAARWKRSLVGGTLTVAGSAPIAGSYVLDVARGAKRRIHVSLKLAPGAYSRAIRLPATLLPGSYHLSLGPASAAVAPGAFDVTLAAPAEGVVDVVALSRARGGRALHSLRRARTLWARFHFAALPRGQVRITWYRTFKGTRTTLAHVVRTPRASIVASLPLRGRTGTITAVVSRGGKIIAQGGVRVT